MDAAATGEDQPQREHGGREAGHQRSLVPARRGELGGEQGNLLVFALQNTILAISLVKEDLCLIWIFDGKMTPNNMSRYQHLLS